MRYLFDTQTERKPIQFLCLVDFSNSYLHFMVSNAILLARYNWFFLYVCQVISTFILLTEKYDTSGILSGTYHMGNQILLSVLRQLEVLIAKVLFYDIRRNILLYIVQTKSKHIVFPLYWTSGVFLTNPKSKSKSLKSQFPISQPPTHPRESFKEAS